jgi:hypothetical protein
MRARFSVLALASLLASLLAPAAEAQFMNRAIWLGEEESFRPPFEQNGDYFIDRGAYVDVPPWWRDGSVDLFANRISIGAGSVNSRELTLESSLQVGVELGEAVTFRAQHLGSEHQSARFQRFGLGFELETSDSGALIAQLEGDADKSRADISFGVEFLRTERSAHRVLFTAADWSEGKSSAFEYDSQPYGLMFAGWFGEPGEVQLSYDLSAQLPFEERRLATGNVLELERVLGYTELRVPIAENDTLVLGLDGELTAKERRTPDPAALERETGDIARARVRLDWWRRTQDGNDWSVGLWAHHLDEDYVLPNALEESLRVRRRSLGVSGRMRLPIDEHWTLEPYLIAGYVDLEEDGSRADDPFQGKVGLPALFHFSDYAFLRFDLSLQLDDAAFGGGGMQLQVSF